MNKFSFKNSQKGFTLIEMIVSLAIFTVVALIAVGALLKIMDANRKSIALKTTINNVNFALESMSRELRVGGEYAPITGGIEFRSSEKNTAGTCNLRYAYRRFGDTLEKAQQDKASGGIGGSCTGSVNNFEELISPDVKITTSVIDIDTTGQPKVFILLKGYSGLKERDKTEFTVQTTVSQRIED